MKNCAELVFGNRCEIKRKKKRMQIAFDVDPNKKIINSTMFLILERKKRMIEKIKIQSFIAY